jgi:hypothetical protein
LVERKKFLIEQERLLAKGDPDMEDVQTLKGTVNSGTSEGYLSVTT